MCNFCRSHDALVLHYEAAAKRREYERLIETIKRRGRGKRYDCIVGVSGGTDSIFTLKLACDLGLRPLAVHFDNGWNKDVAVENIKKACAKLGVELDTYVVNWEEFKALQVAFLRASVPDVEIPTDIAIHGALYGAAKREGISYILGGQCFQAEGTVPIDWSFIDGTYIADIARRFSRRPLKTYPNATVWEIAWDTLVRGIKQVPILNYIPYDKASAKAELERTLDWKYYGGHHYENTYSQFAFGYYTIKKFGFDKRKISLSGPIRMGKISRTDAEREIAVCPEVTKEQVAYVIKKLGLTPDEFEAILAAPNRSFRDYHTSFSALQRLGPVIKAAAVLGVISPVVYEKFVKS